MIVGGGQGSSPDRSRAAGPPDTGRHEVVPEDGNAGATDVGDGGDHVVELFVAALLAEHDLVVEGDGDVFERHQPESGFVDLCSQPRQVLILPAGLAGQ